LANDARYGEAGLLGFFPLARPAVVEKARRGWRNPIRFIG
jgi:hypothetical protein